MFPDIKAVFCTTLQFDITLLQLMVASPWGQGECYDEPDLKRKFSNNAYLLSSFGKCLCDSQTHTTSNTHSTREEINLSSSEIYFNISKIYELTFDHI